ncbi:MAG: hypothetical protein ABI601_17885 [bacterium]
MQVDKQVVLFGECLGMLAEGVDDGVSGLDVQHHGVSDVLERGVLTLLRADVQRCASSILRCSSSPLARDDHDVAHLALAAGPLLLRNGSFVDFDDDEPLLPELRDVVATRRRNDGAVMSARNTGVTTRISGAVARPLP